VAKTKDRSVRQGINKVQNMPIDAGEGPVLDNFNDEERELFLAVVKSGVEAIHKTNPIQQAANMEAFFASSCRSSLFFAGLHVRELRKLKEAFKD
jgi:hypothetical protein